MATSLYVDRNDLRNMWKSLVILRGHHDNDPNSPRGSLSSWRRWLLLSQQSSVKHVAGQQGLSIEALCQEEQRRNTLAGQYTANERKTATNNGMNDNDKHNLRNVHRPRNGPKGRWSPT